MEPDLAQDIGQEKVPSAVREDLQSHYQRQQNSSRKICTFMSSSLSIALISLPTSLLPPPWSSSSFLDPSLASRPQNSSLLCCCSSLGNPNWEMEWACLGVNVCFFLDHSSLLISCIKMGYHFSLSEMQPHYTVRGFDRHGFAHITVHIFSLRHSVVFSNGSNVWKSGYRAMNLQAECEVLR